MMEKYIRYGNPQSRITDKFTWLFGTSIFLKFILLNVIWCTYTTFAPFSHYELYITSLIATLVLLTPYSLFRCRKVQVAVLFLLDMLFIANLMYYRTYYTAIPLSSYLLAGNLADFTQSVYDSVRWYDLLFPVSTIATLCIYTRSRRKERPRRTICLPCLITLVLLCIVFGITLQLQGGFKQKYEEVRFHSRLYACCVPMYTLFGGLYYDLTETAPVFTPEKRQEIETWLAQKPSMQPLPPTTSPRNNCIVIFAESLESWVLEQTVENQEITPYLNNLLKDSTTLYAPHVLTQAKGGRSIDAQLLLCAGLLPLNTGVYSVFYPDNLYYSLPKALKEKRHTRNYLLTIDKQKIWNQGAIARSFGIDTILSHPDFQLTETFGSRKRISDGSFFAQCQEKMEKGEVWKEGENVYLQFVTHSGHTPFHIPNEVKQVSFSPSIPEVMNNYMTAANYTDRAIGKFIEYLKTRPEYAETLIVIAGDHEGLASYRNELCSTPAGKGIVSDKQFTPFIVVNSPVGMRYEKVMGQIDMYPTLLNLLQLDDYCWTGMGQSILDPQKKGFAVGSQMNVEGEEADGQALEQARQAHIVSDMLIRFDYFRKYQTLLSEPRQ